MDRNLMPVHKKTHYVLMANTGEVFVASAYGRIIYPVGFPLYDSSVVVSGPFESSDEAEEAQERFAEVDDGPQ